jgi:DNA-binding phage protein
MCVAQIEPQSAYEDMEGLAREDLAMKDRSHDEAVAELFQVDPAYALELLNSILEDGEQGELLIALRQMTNAFGGVQSVADKANLGNPALSSLAAILKAMGLRLAVERIHAA